MQVALLQSLNELLGKQDLVIQTQAKSIDFI